MGGKKKTPIDPLSGPKLALGGRVVTMDAHDTVIDSGAVFIENGSIVGVRDDALPGPLPAGFEGVPVRKTRGTIYPGLIELHNHLAYNALGLWNVPKAYKNRDQWSGIPEYRKLISGPMNVIGRSPDLLPAVIRYVEVKSLLGGVTTSQGIELFSNHGVRHFYRGLVRNVEATDDPDLKEAATKIADVEAASAEKFLARLRKQSCFLLHLSEGTDDKARAHFLALHYSANAWALAESLAGIHCAALHPEDFAVMAKFKSSMVWSPLSNYLLYGDTAKVRAARDAGVKVGIGPDWSPSGSKNLLGELKVARLASEDGGGFLNDKDVVAMATRTAAAILKWDRFLGTVEAGKRADLLVIDGQNADPYGTLIEAKEKEISLVMIGGVSRYGLPALMSSLGAAGETIRVDGAARTLFLTQATADPVIASISLAAAQATLKAGLKELPKRALALENPPPTPAGAARALLAEAPPTTWSLALDELLPTGLDLRPRVPLRGTRTLTGPSRAAAAPAQPLSKILVPLDLDPLTVADDPAFLSLISKEKNLPAFIKQGLKDLY